MSRLVPIKLVQLLLRVVEAQGFDVDCFLLEHGYNYNPLKPEEQQSTIPTHVSADDYNNLYQGIIHLLQDECFGLYLKGKVPAGTFRMLGLCTIHAKDLESAIYRVHEFTRFCRNMTGLSPLSHTPLIYEDELTVLNVLPETELPESQLQNITSIAASMHMWRKFCSWLISKPLPIEAVFFKGDKPRKTEILEEVFGCPCIFGAQINGFRFARDLLAAPVIHNEDSLNNFLAQAPYQLSVSHFDESSIQICLIIGLMRCFIIVCLYYRNVSKCLIWHGVSTNIKTLPKFTRCLPSPFFKCSVKGTRLIKSH